MIIHREITLFHYYWYCFAHILEEGSGGVVVTKIDAWELLQKNIEVPDSWRLVHARQENLTDEKDLLGGLSEGVVEWR